MSDSLVYDAWPHDALTQKPLDSWVRSACVEQWVGEAFCVCAQQAHKTTCHSNAFCMTDSGCSRRVGKRDDGGMRGSLVSDGLLHDAWPHDASCCHVYICKPCSRGIIMCTTHGHAMHRAITCIYACCSRGIIMRTADGHAIHRGTTCKTA